MYETTIPVEHISTIIDVCSNYVRKIVRENYSKFFTEDDIEDTILDAISYACRYFPTYDPTKDTFTHWVKMIALKYVSKNVLRGFSDPFCFDTKGRTERSGGYTPAES